MELEASPTAADAASSTEHASVEIKHHLWISWARIAIRHLHAAQTDRQRVLKAAAAGEDWAVIMDDEQSNSLIAISAAAHALDAIYGALKPLVAMPRLAADASRHRHIRSALQAAFRAGNNQTAKWKKEFTWLHDLRDAAVHHDEKFRPTVPHPITGNGSYEASRYCMENAGRAIDLMLDVLTVLADKNRAKSDGVREYGSGMALIIQDIKGLADATNGGISLDRRGTQSI